MTPALYQYRHVWLRDEPTNESEPIIGTLCSYGPYMVADDCRCIYCVSRRKKNYRLASRASDHVGEWKVVDEPVDAFMAEIETSLAAGSIEVRALYAEDEG